MVPQPQTPPPTEEAARSPTGAASADAQLARQVHELVRDLMGHRIGVYWVDFLASLTVGYALTWLYLTRPALSLVGSVGFVGGVLLLYRLSVFTHEISHFRRGAYPGFRFAWNALFGVPCLMPSFLYGDHVSHHVNHSYGTRADAEYYPLARGPLWLLVGYFAQVIWIPIGAVVRFGLLTAASLLWPSLRRLVWEKASSIATMNPEYRRPAPPDSAKAEVVAAEWACFAWIATVLGLMAAGVLPWVWLLKIYVFFAGVTLINYTRALGAHRYLNAGDPMSYREQMLDSTTIPGSPLTVLWAPLGMRYHALHHLVPSLPYHSMSEAHRRLVASLPADSQYRDTIRPSLMSAVLDVVRGATRPAE